jgi:hypothetical protein
MTLPNLEHQAQCDSKSGISQSEEKVNIPE